MTPDDIAQLADCMEFRARHAQQNGGTVPHDVLTFYAAELRTLAQQGKAGGVAVYEVQERMSSFAPSSCWTETTRETYEGGYFPETLFHRRILYATPPTHIPDAGNMVSANPPEAGAVVCAWTYDADSRTDAWETGCGNLHAFTADGPAENNHRFCPYCGGNLVIAPQPKDAT